MTNNLKKGFILSLSILIFACANNNNIKNTTFNKEELNVELRKKITGNSKEGLDNKNETTPAEPTSRIKKVKDNLGRMLKPLTKLRKNKDIGSKEDKKALKNKNTTEPSSQFKKSSKKFNLNPFNYINRKFDKVAKKIIKEMPMPSYSEEKEKRYIVVDNKDEKIEYIVPKNVNYMAIIGKEPSKCLSLIDLNINEVIKTFSISKLLNKEKNNEKSIELTTCCFNKNGNKLIIGLSNGTLIMLSFLNQKKDLNVKSGFYRKIIIENAHNASILKIKFNPNFPNKFYTISDDRYFFEWEIHENGFEKTKSFHSLKYNEELDKKSDENLPLLDFHFHSDGKKLGLVLGLGEENKVKIIDLTKDEVVKDLL